ncbi:MAG: hypothetical protein KF809_17235 [Chloroflexi bacterium]|nr:hypothetical protein [Chloroflexota bacterium]
MTPERLAEIRLKHANPGHLNGWRCDACELLTLVPVVEQARVWGELEARGGTSLIRERWRERDRLIEMAERAIEPDATPHHDTPEERPDAA